MTSSVLPPVKTRRASSPTPYSRARGKDSAFTFLPELSSRTGWLDGFAAYGWENTLSDEGILERLLALNLERAK